MKSTTDAFACHRVFSRCSRVIIQFIKNKTFVESLLLSAAPKVFCAENFIHDRASVLLWWPILSTSCLLLPILFVLLFAKWMMQWKINIQRAKLSIFQVITQRSQCVIITILVCFFLTHFRWDLRIIRIFFFAFALAFYSICLEINAQEWAAWAIVSIISIESKQWAPRFVSFIFIIIWIVCVQRGEESALWY